ncbi:MAG: hypothetical protein ACRDRQ_21455 [Pseudonocardiaceae bacterium]
MGAVGERLGEVQSIGDMDSLRLPQLVDQIPQRLLRRGHGGVHDFFLVGHRSWSFLGRAFSIYWLTVRIEAPAVQLAEQRIQLRRHRWGANGMSVHGVLLVYVVG